MQSLLLLGDEAIAQAALDAGMSGMYAYPGYPFNRDNGICSVFSRRRQKGMFTVNGRPNEKTAMEAALGMSYAGKRAMVAMKHVGLNVAADAFINSAVTGVNGGLIVVAADDPSMHSSQNEQDSRFYGKFAMVPVFEPRNQQEAYDMIFDAFDLSEKLQVAGSFSHYYTSGTLTRLCHTPGSEERRTNSSLPYNPRQFVLLPAIARKQYRALTVLFETLPTEPVISGWNRLRKGTDRQ